MPYKLLVLISKTELERLRLIEKKYGRLVKRSVNNTKGYGFKEDTELKDIVARVDERNEKPPVPPKSLPLSQTQECPEESSLGSGASTSSMKGEGTNYPWWFLGN